jgi:SAM-dependent methyltransferase
VSSERDVRELAARYSADAAAYRRHYLHVMVPLGRALLEGLRVEHPRRALDLGTGVGSLLPEIARRWPQALVVGADRAPGMIALAPRTFPRVVADAAALPFDGGSFDAVVMAFMLFHVPDPRRALREVRRALVSGGAVAVGTWAEAPDYPALEIWTEELDRAGASVDVPVPSAHDLLDEPAKVASLLGEAGFFGARSDVVDPGDRMDLEEFVARRVETGHFRQLYESLAPDARASVLERARRRLEGLPAEAFTDRMQAILTWARAP